MIVIVDSVSPEGGVHTECALCGYGFVPGDTCFIEADLDNHPQLVCKIEGCKSCESASGE